MNYEIKPLPKEVIDKIRSGVNIGSVSQCVEELVLNSIDAKASCIAVRLDLPYWKIQVVDNGYGIEKKQLDVIGERYHTSKCHVLEDISQLKFYGFRGEALASLKDMSGIVEIESRFKNSKETFGKVFSCKNKRTSDVTIREIKRPSSGTTITIIDFMHNLPVRKSLICPVRDIESCRRRIESIALMHPDISFSLRNDSTGEMCLQTKKSKELLSIFRFIYGHEKTENVKLINYTQQNLNLEGLISTEGHYSKDLQYLYLNKRLVLKTRFHQMINLSLGKILLGKYKKGLNLNTLPVTSSQSPKKEKIPIFVLNLTCDLNIYDITFEPSKSLVEFEDWDLVLGFFESALKSFISEHFPDETIEERTNVIFENLNNVGICNDITTENAKNSMHSLVAERIVNPQSPKMDKFSPQDYKTPEKVSTFSEKHFVDVPVNLVSKKKLVAPFECSYYEFKKRFKPLNKDTDRVWTLQPEIPQSCNEKQHVAPKTTGIKNNTKINTETFEKNQVGQMMISKFQFKPSDTFGKHSGLEKSQPQSITETNSGPFSVTNESGSNSGPFSVRYESPTTSEPFSIIEESPTKTEPFSVSQSFKALTSSPSICGSPIIRLSSVLDIPLTGTMNENSTVINKNENTQPFELISSPNPEAILNIEGDKSSSSTKTNNDDATRFDTCNELHSVNQYSTESSLVNELRSPKRIVQIQFPALSKEISNTGTDESIKSQNSSNTNSWAHVWESLEDKLDSLFGKIENTRVSSSELTKLKSKECMENSELNSESQFNSWKSCKDPDTGSVLYINKNTGNSSFTLPQKEEERLPESDMRKPKHIFLSHDSSPFHPRSNRNIRNRDESAETAVSGVLKEWENPVFKRTDFTEINDVSNTEIFVKTHCSLSNYRFHKCMLENVKVIGQIDNKFIACILNNEENENLLVLFDQHAVHERIRLEFLMNDLYVAGKIMKTSNITPPLLLNMGAEWVRLAQAYPDELKKIAINVVFNSTNLNYLSVSTAPPCVIEKEANCLKRGKESMLATYLQIMIKEQLTRVRDKTMGPSLPLTLQNVLNSRACRGAIKFGEKLSLEKCHELISSLGKCDLPFQCAHGRPSLVGLLNFVNLKNYSTREEHPKYQNLTTKDCGKVNFFKNCQYN